MAKVSIRFEFLLQLREVFFLLPGCILRDIMKSE